MHYIPIDIYDYQKPKTEIVRYHGAKESETDSEGMTNKNSSCWMISVMQALRASNVFTKEFQPAKDEKDKIRKDLFHLFDIVAGNNGQKKRALKAKEVEDFRELVRKAGLPVKKSGGYSEVKFITFLLKHLNAKPIEYYKDSNKQKDPLFIVRPTESTKQRSLEAVIKQNKLSFATKDKAPKFLPIQMKRPLFKGENNIYEASRTPVEPSTTLRIPVSQDGSSVEYKLVSIVIARDSVSHSYSYVLEKKGWVEYNNHKAVLHTSPKTKKRTKEAVHTPYEDACKHSEILIYERT